MHNWVIKEEYARLQQVIFKVPLENPFLTTFIGFNVPIVFQIPWGEQKKSTMVSFFGLGSASRRRSSCLQISFLRLTSFPVHHFCKKLRW